MNVKMNTMTSPTDKLKRILDFIRKGDLFLSELELLKAQQVNPAEHPATAVLVEAYMMRLEQIVAAIKGLPRDLTQVSVEVPRLQVQLMDELQEIGSWLKRQRRPDHEDFMPGEMRLKQDTIGDWLVSVGFSYSEATRVMEAATKPKRGAPVARRSDILAAYDMKSSKGLSLRQVTMKVCDCGEATHSSACQDRLRKRFHELEKLLEKYSLKIDSPQNERK
jgi:hypothetical protein